MIKITFPDGFVREYHDGVTGLEIAESISSRLAQDVLACGVNGETYDLTRPITQDAEVRLYKWEDEEGKYLSAINLQYADEVLPVFDFNICIRTEKPAKITRVSDGREMGFEYSDGKLVLHIDRLDLYEMFDIQI